MVDTQSSTPEPEISHPQGTSAPEVATTQLSVSAEELSAESSTQTAYALQRVPSGVVGRFWRLPAVGLISIARFYQICLSPLLPAVCRFEPTCSSYFIQSVQKYGAVKGSFKGAMRICRCHPWGGCGHDPP